MKVILSCYNYDNAKVHCTYTGAHSTSREIASIKELCKRDFGSFDQKKLRYKWSKTEEVDRALLNGLTK